MPQVDHCVGQGFECAVQITYVFESQQQAPKFAVPRVSFSGYRHVDALNVLCKDSITAYGWMLVCFTCAQVVVMRTIRSQASNERKKDFHGNPLVSN